MGTENPLSADVSMHEVHAKKLLEEKKGSSRKRRILIFTLVSLLNGALLGLLWSQLLTPAPNQAQNQAGSVQESSPLDGHPAPDGHHGVIHANRKRLCWRRRGNEYKVKASSFLVSTLQIRRAVD